MNREIWKTQKFQECQQRDNCRGRSGFVLLITVVLLVVLSTLAYALTSRVAAQRHRCQYLIDYQTARYACDSGVKYAIAALEGLEIELVDRPNEPDFSDLFAMSEQEYQQYLDQWVDAMDYNDVNDVNSIADANGTLTRPARNNKGTSGFDFFNMFTGGSDIVDLNERTYREALEGFDIFGGLNDLSGYSDVKPPQMKVRGPYGPEWPLVMQPAELEIGSAKVTIEIEDENAKYPATWVMIEDEEVQDGVQAGFQTFCEWMKIGDEDVSTFVMQMDEVNKIKPFKDYLHQAKDAVQPAPVAVQQPTSQEPAQDSRRAAIIRRQAEAAKALAAKQRIIPEATHKQDYIKLMHSSLIDTEALSRPTIISESRKESALKYMCMWASKRVNINTAPRHVLEAVFAIGGDAEAIAEGIIQARRIKPFKDIEELRSSMLGYSDSIKRCEDYITTASDTFIVRITAVSGAAKASAVIAVLKNGKKVERLAIVNG